ncbi:hypothetical protein F5878DRAFT_658976 [Lentinula raphanica]|uniref:Uncharacterized protein n=1 Tax=Lentinula raphanica TaxID=153919 RepID=A0AA38PE53_9AGAR|nr:hypothetical protein F5878DRAFT_658976 [Lentinula raphanica]
MSSLCSLHTYHLLKLVLSGRRLTLDISSHPSRSLSSHTRRLLTLAVSSHASSPHTRRPLTFAVSSHLSSPHILTPPTLPHPGFLPLYLFTLFSAPKSSH